MSTINEAFILVAAFCLLAFVDGVCTDTKVQTGMGWFLIVWINLIAAINMSLAAVKTIRLIFSKLRRWWMSLRNSQEVEEEEGEKKEVVETEKMGEKEDMESSNSSSEEEEGKKKKEEDELEIYVEKIEEIIFVQERKENNAC